MSANLITGNLFSPILASQDSDYQAGVSGDKTLILPVGAKMSLEIEDANTIRANDGVLVTKEGRRVQIDTGAVEEWSIPTGTQGETSYYLIGFHLYTTEESAEICETFIEKVASATDTITEDTFKGGATEVYITLGRVTQDGINLDSVEGLIDTADSLTDLGAKITQINNDLTDNGETFKFGYNSSTDEMGYYKKVSGADTFFPFKIGEFKKNILWTNSTPTSNFSNSTVTLSDNINNFDCIGIKFRYSTNNDNNITIIVQISDWINTESANTNGTSRLSCAFKITNGTTFRASYYDSDTSVYFTHAYNVNASTIKVALADNTVIPVEIIGLNIV